MKIIPVIFALFSLNIVVLNATASDITQPSTYQSSISLMDVLKSTLSHHPQIRAAQAQVKQAEAKQLASRGSFDWKIEHSSQTRLNGYYDGRTADQSISRQLPWANAKISSGYRRSRGSFPSSSSETLSDGEANLKLSLALLKDRAIDEERNQLRQADLGFELAEIDFSLDMNALLLEASFSYLDWQQACREVKITRELESLASSRRDAIVAQVESGDMANIVLTEFDTTLLNRSLAVLERKQSVAVAGKELSMYWRNDDGEPVTLGLANCLRAGSFDAPFEPRNALYELDQHPLLVRISNEIQQIKNTRQLAKNELLPELDMEVVLAEDFGQGPESLDGFESYVGLSFSVPLQRRKAKGQFAEDNAKLKELEQKRQQMLDKLRIDIDATLISIENTEQQFSTQKKRAAVTKKLAEQELLRFNAGDSDQFVLNTRERNIGVAVLSLIDIETDLIRLKLRLLAQLAKLDSSVKKKLDMDT